MGKTLFLVSVVIILLFVSVGAQQSGNTPTKKFTKETASDLTVEAALCTSVVDREPVGKGTTFSSDIGGLYLWSKVMGATDTTVVEHLWYYKGVEMASVKLPVKSKSWRTWSRKRILPEWTGAWEVKIVDADWRVLKTISFTIE